MFFKLTDEQNKKYDALLDNHIKTQELINARTDIDEKEKKELIEDEQQNYFFLLVKLRDEIDRENFKNYFSSDPMELLEQIDDYLLSGTEDFRSYYETFQTPFYKEFYDPTDPLKNIVYEFYTSQSRLIFDFLKNYDAKNKTNYLKALKSKFTAFSIKYAKEHPKNTFKSSSGEVKQVVKFQPLPFNENWLKAPTSFKVINAVCFVEPDEIGDNYMKWNIEKSKDIKVSITLDQRFSIEEMQVFEEICSIYFDQFKNYDTTYPISFTTLYQNLTGSKDRCREEQQEQIEKILLKLNSANIKIENPSEEAYLQKEAKKTKNQYKLENYKTTKIPYTVQPFAHIEINAAVLKNNTYTKTFEIKEIPVLYKYFKRNRELINIPRLLLDTTKSNKIDRVLYRELVKLLYTLNIRKGTQQINLSFDKIYNLSNKLKPEDRLDPNAPNFKKNILNTFRRDRALTEKTLDYAKQQGLIVRYEEYYKSDLKEKSQEKHKDKKKSAVLGYTIFISNDLKKYASGN